MVHPISEVQHHHPYAYADVTERSSPEGLTWPRPSIDLNVVGDSHSQRSLGGIQSRQVPR
jgi:hypothetical protein